MAFPDLTAKVVQKAIQINEAIILRDEEAVVGTHMFKNVVD